MPRSCGERRRPSASREVRQPQPSRNSCSRSALACGSAIHWSGRPPTPPGRPRIAALRTRRSPRRQMPTADPERRVWHLAAAATGPDEAVAAAARTDGGHGSGSRRVGGRGRISGAFGRIDRRAGTTRRASPRRGPGPHARRRVRRGSRLVGRGPSGGGRRRAARPDRAAQGAGPVCVQPGTRGASSACWRPPRRLEPLDVQLARETYLDAWLASFVAGHTLGPGGRLPEVSQAARSAPPPPERAPPCDLFLDGLAKLVTDGHAAAAPSLRVAVDAFLGDEVSDDDFVQWGHLATSAACTLWDWKSWEALSAKHVELARVSGALAPLSIALNGRGLYAAWCGDLEAAAAIIAEYDAVNEATGIGWYSAAASSKPPTKGRPEALAYMAASAADSVKRGMGHGSQFATWTTGDPLQRSRPLRGCAGCRAAGGVRDGDTRRDGVGAARADRGGRQEPASRNVARDAMEQLSRHTLDGADWAVGHRGALPSAGDRRRERRALVHRSGAAACRTPLRTELARAHLLYGEWLRRERRRVDAREQLASAYEMFSAMGAEAFAERARRELVATGEKVRKRDADPRRETS